VEESDVEEWLVSIDGLVKAPFCAATRQLLKYVGGLAPFQTKAKQSITLYQLFDEMDDPCLYRKCGLILVADSQL
jgi:hypothetical protein